MPARPPLICLDGGPGVPGRVGAGVCATSKTHQLRQEETQRRTKKVRPVASIVEGVTG